MAEDFISKIKYEYDNNRSVAERKCRERAAEVYEKFPKIKEIDDKIKFAGISNMKNIMSNPQNADEINEKFQKELSKLVKERKKALKESGIEENFDKPVYKCSLCKDTGYFENRKCNCFIEKLKANEYKTSNLDKLSEKQNFENFDLSYYSDKPNSEGDIPRQRMEKILEFAKSFCDNFETTEKNLIFHGEPGLGKTFLSSCIAKEIIEKGKSVLYISATKLFNIYDNVKFNNRSTKEMEDIIDKVYECDLLIIDDFGTEFITKNSYSFLFDFFNERLINNRKMIISTNLKMSQIADTYNDRFTSRLYESFLILGFLGNDIRIKKFIK